MKDTMVGKIVKLPLGRGNRKAPVSKCGANKGCKVVKLPFTRLPDWDTDHVEYKRA